MLARLITQLGDLVVGGIRLEQGMIDQPGDIGILGIFPRVEVRRSAPALTTLPDCVEAGDHAHAFGAIRREQVAALGLERLYFLFLQGDQDFAGDDFDYFFNGLNIQGHIISPLSGKAFRPQ